MGDGYKDEQSQTVQCPEQPAPSRQHFLVEAHGTCPREEPQGGGELGLLRSDLPMFLLPPLPPSPAGSAPGSSPRTSGPWRMAPPVKPAAAGQVGGERSQAPGVPEMISDSRSLSWLDSLRPP